MRSRRGDDSLDDEWEDDREDPAEADQDADDDPETVACPFCGKQLVEEAEVCSQCGSFVGGADDSTTRTHPKWVIMTAVILLAVIAMGLVKWMG